MVRSRRTDVTKLLQEIVINKNRCDEMVRSVHGLLAVGQFAVKKKLISVRLGQIKLS